LVVSSIHFSEEFATFHEENPGMPRIGRTSASSCPRLFSLLAVVFFGGVLRAAGQTQSPVFPETAAGLNRTFAVEHI
jgi:hypothetical protein